MKGIFSFLFDNKSASNSEVFPQKTATQINIFVDCHVFDGSFQGTTTYLKGIYLEMIKYKHIHYFFAAKDIDNLIAIFGIHDNVHFLKYKTDNKFYRLLFDIPNLIKTNKIDYAHFQYVVPPIKHCKYINTIHDVLFLDFPEYFSLFYRIKNNFLFKWSAKKSDIVLTVSEYSKVRIEQNFKIKNLVVIPNAVDEAFYQEYDKSEMKDFVKEKFGIENYFLFVSRIESRKNHLTLLKVFVENDYYKSKKLVFVGKKVNLNPNYLNYYNKLSNEIKNKIIHFDNLSFEDLLPVVRAADLSVYPSLAEGFGIPPLESLAANVPTVCSNSTAMSDFDFMDNYLFDPLNENDLKLKINLALNSLNTVSPQQIKNNYNWQASALKLYKIVC